MSVVSWQLFLESGNNLTHDIVEPKYLLSVVGAHRYITNSTSPGMGKVHSFHFFGH
jgi:hypothetical protein